MASAKAQPLPAPPTPARYYLHLGLGRYDPAGNNQFTNPQGNYSLQFGGGRRMTPNFAWEIDFATYQQDVDTPGTITAPVFGTKDPRSTLSTTGIAGTAKFIQPIGSLDLHAGMGLGVYTVRFRATGQQFGLPVELTRDQTRPGWHASAGAAFKVTDKMALGLEYRRLSVQASFDDIAPGTIEAGGSAWLLQLRYEP